MWDGVVIISRGVVRVSGGVVLGDGWYRMYVMIQHGVVQYSSVIYTRVHVYIYIYIYS